MVVTISTVDVSTVYSGSVAQRIEVETIGGETEFLKTHDDYEAKLSVDSYYLLFLAETSGPRYTTWGAFQGAARITPDGRLTTRYPVPWNASTISQFEDDLGALIAPSD